MEFEKLIARYIFNRLPALIQFSNFPRRRIKQLNECLVFIGGGRDWIARSPRIIYEISGDYGKRDSDAEWLAPKSDYYATHNNARAYTSY